MNAALKWHLSQNQNELYEREHHLMQMFYDGVKSVPGVTIYGDFEAEKRAPIVTLNIEDYPSSMVSDELSERFGIATRSGAHCAPLMHQALGTEAQGSVRFSFSHFNTEDEVQTAIDAIRILATEE